MIEMIDSFISMAVLTVCAIISFLEAYKGRGVARRAWVLFGLFAGEYFFSDLYGVLFLIFYDETPMYYIQDMLMLF